MAKAETNAPAQSSAMEVTSKRKQEDGSVIEHTVQYDFGSNLQDAVAKFGEETVFGQFVKKSKIDLQTLMGSRLTEGKTADEINAEVAEWQPSGEVKQKASPKQKIIKAYASMSDDEKRALLAKLQAEMA